jgi:DNA-binding winged helix-turn-helix (wHTH) protein/tetratricopeptide (TPR) repeat protein
MVSEHPEMFGTRSEYPARVEKGIRVMGPGKEEPAYRFDEFRLDIARGTLRGPGGTELVLRPKAFSLLCHLVMNPGRLLRREELLRALWPDVAVTDDSLTQCVSDLRRAFGDRAASILRTLPRRGYVLVAEVRREAPLHAPTPTPAMMPATGDRETDRRDVVAVRPFESHDSDPLSGRAAATLTTDLIAAFARCEDVLVVSDAEVGAAHGYRLLGEINAQGTHWRVTARLETAGGATLWADRIEPLRDISPALPAEAVWNLAALLARQLAWQNLLRARRRAPAERNVRDLLLLGKEHHQRSTAADTLLAYDLFAAAMAADPDYALPYAWQSYTVQRAITSGWGPLTAEEAWQPMLRMAQQAVQLAPDSPLCVSRLAFALMLHRRWDEAVEMARSAFRTGKTAFFASRITSGEVLAHAGHAEEAVEAMRFALSFDPMGPPTGYALLGRALLLAGKPDEALVELRRCAARLPDYAPCYHSLVVAAVETGRMEEARSALREVLRLQPGWVPRNHARHWFFRRPEDLARFQSAFEAVGMARLIPAAE